MVSSAKSMPQTRRIKLSQIVLPTEHGSWGFLFEPLVGGLALAFSIGGLWISLMVIGAFLMRRPLQVLITQWRSNSETRAVAQKFVATFLFVTAIGFVGVLFTADLVSLSPLIISLPLACFQFYTEATKRGRQLVAELAGAAIMPTSAAAIVIAGGGEFGTAAAIWFFFVARFIPSILYVRNRLSLEKGKKISPLWTAILHTCALFGVAGLTFTNKLPMFTVAAFLLLFLRSAIGLSQYRKRMKAMKIGVLEVFYGLVTVTFLIVGHYLGW